MKRPVSIIQFLCTSGNAPPILYIRNPAADDRGCAECPRYSVVRSLRDASDENWWRSCRANSPHKSRDLQ